MNEVDALDEEAVEEHTGATAMKLNPNFRPMS